MSKLFSKPKALLSAVLVLCMVISMLPLGLLSVSAAAWDGSVPETYEFEGEGTSQLPYLIGSGEALAYLAKEVNAGNEDYSGKYFKLTDDIDLGGSHNWTPIGTSENKFAGTFDGNDCTVKGLYINVTAHQQGLFGYVGENTTIKNLNVVGADITAYTKIGGIVGQSRGHLTMENCTFEGTIQGYIGTSKTGDDTIGIGGMVGSFDNANVTINNCVAKATLSGHRYYNAIDGTGNTGLTWALSSIGGLVGALSTSASGTITITNSSTDVSMNGTYTLANGNTAKDGSGIGGIIGTLRNPERSATSTSLVKLVMQNCHSSGTASANSIGGLLGYIRNPGLVEADFDDCYSTMTGISYGLLASIMNRTTEGDGVATDFTININNSFFAGSASYPIAPAPTAGMNMTVDNVYYRKGSATGANALVESLNDETISISNVAEKSAAEFADGTVKDLLNGDRDVWKQGEDYPVLKLPEPPLSALTINGGTVDDLAGHPFSYSTSVSSTTESITVVATPAKTGAKVTNITAVDENGTAMTVTDNTVALAAGRTTTITIEVTHKLVPTTYTVNVYRAPTPWNGTDVSTSLSGSGTSTDPWLISNAADLVYFGNSIADNSGYSGKYFKITADVDLNEVNLDSFGADGTGFKGTLDGGNHTIFNYNNANASTTKTQTGFFTVLYGATVKNFHLSNARIHDTNSGANQIGGFAAVSFGTVTLTNCSFDGTIYSSHCNFIGTLIGWVRGGVNITDCWTTGSINAASRGAPGGLLGNCYTNNTFTITSSWSAMDVIAKGSGYVAGGLIGGLTNATATLNITDSYFAGTINHPYPISPVASGATATQKISVTNTYYKNENWYTGTTQNVVAGGECGVGKSAADFASGAVATLLGSNWTTWNGQPVLYKGYEFALSGIEGFVANVTEYAATSKGTYSFDVADATEDTHVLVSADKAEALTSAGNRYTVTTEASETVVVTIAGYKNGHKVIYTLTVADARWNGEPDDAYAGGNGTEATPYQIANAAQLALMAQEINAGTNTKAYFELTADIDLSGYTWTPIGSSSNKFSGSFNGNDHTITGMTYVDTVNTGAGYIALFGATTTGVRITNVHIRNAELITKKTYIAGLIGYCNGSATIENCTFTGHVEGSATYGDAPNVAGLIGSISTSAAVTIDNCAVLAGSMIVSHPGTITYGPQGTGGLISSVSGGTDLTIKNSHFAGEVDAKSRVIDEKTVKGARGVAGLIGLINNTAQNNTLIVNIENCYTTGKIAGNSDVAGLVGYVRCQNGDPTGYAVDLKIDNCYSTAELDISTATSMTYGLYAGFYTTYVNATPSISITNSHFAGKAKKPICSYSPASTGAKLKVENVYFKEGSYSVANDILDTINGDTATVANVAEKTVEEFANGTVAKLLGTGWATSSKGYPIHSTFVTPDNALDRLGTSIRTYTPGGMRFYFKMANAAQITGLKEYGVVMAKAENATDGLFVGGTKTAKAKAFDGETTSHVREDETHDYFSAVITFKTDKNHETAYYARAYALYTDNKGQELIVYSDTTTTVHDDDYNSGEPVPCTLVNVAEIALADKEVKFSNSEVAYLEAIAKKKSNSFE